MIYTYDIKQQKDTVFTLESLSGPKEVILVVGSCRSVPLLNYLNRYNQSAGRPYRIHFIDPFDWHWGSDGELVDLEEALRKCETNPHVRRVLDTTTIFLHEHYAYFGMFNTSKDNPKNIYQFGLEPKLNICFPNFNDHFVLFVDQLKFDPELRARVGTHPSPEHLAEMKARGLAAMEKFYHVCQLGSFPEMADHVRENWTKERYFWSFNHIAKAFSLYIFRRLNDRFFNWPLDDSFWSAAGAEDMYKSPSTPATIFDKEAYGLEWNEEYLCQLPSFA